MVFVHCYLPRGVVFGEAFFVVEVSFPLVELLLLRGSVCFGEAFVSFFPCFFGYVHLLIYIFPLSKKCSLLHWPAFGSPRAQVPWAGSGIRGQCGGIIHLEILIFGLIFWDATILNTCNYVWVQATGEDFSVEPSDERRPFRALLDVGLLRTTTGNRVFGALKVCVLIRLWMVGCTQYASTHGLTWEYRA
jgi:hypothetical protein